MRLAVFDFDQTLLRGNSWQLFFWRTVRRSSWRAPWLLVCLGLRRLRVVSSRFLQEQALASLRGCTEEEVLALGRHLYGEVIAPRLRPAALGVLAQQREEGAELVLLTGAFDFLVKPFVEDHGVARWRATRLHYAGGRCTGRIDRPRMVGEEKRRALLEMAAAECIDWEASSAYGDELTDLPMMDLVGHPVFVCTGRCPSGLSAKIKVERWGD
jgi:putative phosphoserine phosphatase/1-acylglycerol-3-phosphate O-acyltransferase